MAISLSLPNQLHVWLIELEQEHYFTMVRPWTCLSYLL